jgi:hypothetical protein
MKRLVIVLFVLAVAASGAFAQFSFTEFQSDFQAFAGEIANALPFNASIGNNWSDAYIGQLIGMPPHLGVGATVGATTIPLSAVASLVSAVGAVLPPEVSSVTGFGFPVPAYTADLRLGGFALPFDLGLKVGYLPPDALQGLPFTVDYLLIGGDVRFALLKEDILLPAISVGAGYTFMHGKIGIGGLLPGGITLASFTFPDNSVHTLGFTNPSLNFAWDTNVIDLKAQISKSLLIITPYLGVGASYGISSAGGGVSSAMTVDGSPASQSDIDAINSMTGGSYTLQNPGIQVLSSANGWAFRAWGGLSLNILVLRLDLNVLYNFTSGSLGGSAGARIQI